MSRYSGAGSYGHWCRPAGYPGEWEIGWQYDRYYHGSRLRHPTGRSRITDNNGARRFCKRWGLALPQPLQE